MRKLVSVLLTLAVVLGLSLAMAAPVAVSAGGNSYSADMGKACWSYSLNITETPPGWSPLTVNVSYADGKATFVITPPVAFNTTAPNDNFWLIFDSDNDGTEDFQVLYNTRLPSEDPSQTYNFHWAKKTYNGSWSDYQEVPGDWNVSATGALSQFTVTMPVSYLGGANSNYGFQIGLVKYVYETDWQTEWGNIDFDPICEGWSTQALIFVPLPSEGWESEATPGNTAVGLTAETPTITAINVDPTSIDFGTVNPGDVVLGDNITVENIGTVKVDVDASLAPLTGTVFNYLKLNGVPSPAYCGDWADYIISGLKPSLNQTLTTVLDVPPTYTAQGPEATTLIFEATAA